LCDESLISYSEDMTSTTGMATYNDRFEEIVRQSEDRVAVRFKTVDGYRQITYGELYRKVLAVAQALVDQGVHKGARVAILSENRPEWVVAYLGIYFAGGSAVPLDAQISPQEWRRLLDDSESQWVFVSGLLIPKLEDAVRNSQLRNRVICFDTESSQTARWSLDGLIEHSQGLARASALPRCELSDVVVIIYTSGTTGKPKGVMLTQQNIVSDIEGALSAIHGINRDDAFLCLLPLQHVFASVVSFLVPLYVGGQAVFADTLKRVEILAALQEAGITILATVPQFFYLFHGRIEEELARKGAATRRLFRFMLRINRFCLRAFRINLGKPLFGKIHKNFGSRLRLFVSGGSAFDAKVAQEFHDLGFTILQGYGLTETTGACAVTRLERNVIGSVGSAIPGAGIKILEPNPAGEGEVAIRGPMVMKGYYRNPEGTAEVMRDGWFLSGDLGRMDAHGILFITGRKKEVIVLPNGKNIYPDELEAHYVQSPFILEIAVLGITDVSHQGAERLHAVVVPDFDYLKVKKIANAREIMRDEIARLSNQLPQYKRLMSYQIQQDPLPRTTTRKIKRLELKHLIETGALRELEAAGKTEPVSADDRELQESPIGQEVLAILRDTYHRNTPIESGMNLELDLGFDSMERVELLASLEQALGFVLPEDFGAEVFTVRDLIRGLREQSATSSTGGLAQKQSWQQILSAESLSQDDDWHPHFCGTTLDLVRYVGVRILFVIFKILFRYEAAGTEHLPRDRTFLLCPNHASYLDPLMVLAALPYAILKRVFFVGASEFFTMTWMKILARVANIFPVDPDAHLLRAMKVGAYGLQQGRILCIFPEGARSFDGKPMPFKKGAAILSRELGMPIIPVAIQGAFEAWPRDSRRIRLHKIKVVFGAPLEIALTNGDGSYQADTNQLQQAVTRLLETSQHPPSNRE
jgi:long-chain acyl-CoA synthetase